MGKAKNIILKIDETLDANIQPENIKKGVEILGVTGTMEGATTKIEGYIWCGTTTSITLSNIPSEPKSIKLVYGNMDSNNGAYNLSDNQLENNYFIYAFITMCNKKMSIRRSKNFSYTIFVWGNEDNSVIKYSFNEDNKTLTITTSQRFYSGYTYEIEY